LDVFRHHDIFTYVGEHPPRKREGRTTDVSAWLLITVIAAIQVISQLISIVGVVWHELARAASHCIQMETAASRGAVLYERLEDGTVLLVSARSAGEEEPAPEWAMSGAFHEHPLS
jgi:hypothetical protein